MVVLILVIAIFTIYIWAAFSARKNKEEDLGTFIFNNYFRVKLSNLIFAFVLVIVPHLKVARQFGL